MKIFVSNDDLKVIQEALYKYQSAITEDLANQKPSQTVVDIVEERIAGIEKLILYINDRIEDL